MRTMDLWYARTVDEDRLKTVIQDALAAETSAAVKKETARRPRRPRRTRRTQARRGSEGGGPAGGEEPREGAHPRQPAGAVQAGRTGRRAVPDRQPAAGDRAGAATWPPRTACPPDDVLTALHNQFRAYRATLPDDRRQLLERFEIVDVARKVVGVGSVGTRAFIVLLQGRDAAGPAVPAGQGGDRPRCSRHHLPTEPVPAARRAGGAGSADDAGRQRHLPGLDQGPGRPAGTSTGASCAT